MSNDDVPCHDHSDDEDCVCFHEHALSINEVDQLDRSLLNFALLKP